MKSAQSECDFCEEGRTGEVAGGIRSAVRTSKRIVTQSSAGYVVPTISPIVNGHLLVVSRIHVRSQRQLPESLRLDLRELTDEARALIPGDCGGVLTFEHGIGMHQNGGCGVEHCHIHLLPLSDGAAVRVFRAILSHGDSETLEEACIGITDSYAFVRFDEGTNSRSLWRTGTFPSQFLRNAVEIALGLPQSNWRDVLLKDTREFAGAHGVTEWS